MESCVLAKLGQLKYNISTTAYGYIDTCNAWYKNDLIADFHRRISVQGDTYEIERMNFAKRGCADDANLCEVIQINIGNEAQTDAINKVLNDNRFNVMYRQQLERMSATGTVAAYVRIKNATYLSSNEVTGGDIKIEYCYAENYIPLRVENEEVIEACFAGTDYVNGKKQTTMVMFTKPNGTNYKANTYAFDDGGKEIESYWMNLGDIKPFSVMRVAEVNNLDNMQGFGLPKILGAIPTLKKIDLCNMILTGDLDKGEKLVLTNEALVELDPATGQPVRKNNKLLKRLFVFLGEKLPEMKSVIQEYNPQIRIDDITKCYELCLSLFSMMFGFGSKKYTFEQGQIQTATQYLGERQDAMQELNKQRKEATDYITGIVRAIIWYSNTFKGTKYDINSEICIDYDDSYIEDKTTKMQSLRDDAISFSDIPEFTIRYIMERLNVDRDEAVKIYKTKEIESDETED